MERQVEALERIAVALEARNAAAQRGALKVEPGAPVVVPKKGRYYGQPEPTAESSHVETERGVSRRPRQGART
jgi:hypothetical protein